MQLPGCLALSAEHGAERGPRRALRHAGRGKQHVPRPSACDARTHRSQEQMRPRDAAWWLGAWTSSESVGRLPPRPIALVRPQAKNTGRQDA
eukprot:8571901-Alexandrium_andersonii.AAC.1